MHANRGQILIRSLPKSIDQKTVGKHTKTRNSKANNLITQKSSFRACLEVSSTQENFNKKKNILMLMTFESEANKNANKSNIT